MPNSGNEIVQDHRVLSEWSMAGPDNESEPIQLPIDMRFNDGHRLSITVYSVLMIISSIGNITVLVLLIKRRLRGPSRIDIMLMHLAIADLLVTFLMMPMEIGWAYTVSWQGGDILCRIMAFFRTFGLYLSSFVLVCISVDRYFAVLKPLKLSDTRGRMMIVIAWLSSCICSTPQAVIFHLETHPNITWYEQCVTYNSFDNELHSIIYSVMGMVLMYALPLIIIIFCYASIYIEIYRKSRQKFAGLSLRRRQQNSVLNDKVVRNGNPGTESTSYRFRRSNDDVLGRAKRRTLKMTITIVIAFVVCWTPFYVMSIWYWLDHETALKVDQRIQKGLFLFACTNSCMNPIVYGVYNIRRKREKKNMTINNRHTSISKRVENRNSTEATPTVRTPTVPNNVRRTICMSCGDSIELPNLRNHNLYH